MKLKVERLVGQLHGCQFADANNQPCSISESSATTFAGLWLGVEEHRMLLTQEQAAALVPMLERFANTGRLKP